METNNVSVMVKEREEIIEAVAAFSAEGVAAISASRNEPAWMRQFRLDAWATFESIPWPKSNDEAWRRTRLTGFKLEKFKTFTDPVAKQARTQLPALLQTELDEMDSAASLIFQDGGAIYGDVTEDFAAKGVIFTDLQTALRDHSDLVQKYFMTQAVPAGHNKFSALHAALWDTGTFVFVPANAKVDLPLQVVLNQSAAGMAGFHHTLVVAETGANVTVVDDLLGAKDGMQCDAVEIIMGDNSVVRYVNLQDFDHSAWNFLNGRAIMGKDTDLRWIQVSWGSRLTKAFLDLDMQGKGGHGELLGIYFPTGKQHIDHQTLQIHRAPHCFSDLLFNGALKEKARNVYMGIIKVLPDAQKTDAFQRNGNLILDNTARADSIPGLEIEADDVRCTHAATAAQVEDEYVFYLQARGLTRPQAERMIVQGFFQAVLDRVPVESVVHKLERVIERKIGG